MGLILPVHKRLVGHSNSLTDEFTYRSVHRTAVKRYDVRCLLGTCEQIDSVSDCVLPTRKVRTTKDEEKGVSNPCNV